MASYPLNQFGVISRIKTIIIVSAVASVSLFARGSSTAPTLKLSPAVTHIPVKQGTSVTDVFTFVGGGSFSGSVSVSISGLPSYVSASWSSESVKLSSGVGTSTLTLKPSSTAPPNWYSFTVTAKGDGLTTSEGYTVEVAPSNGMQVELSQSALSIERKGTATLSVTAKPLHGVTIPSGAAGASATITSSLPTGITASWSKPSIVSGSVKWTLTLSADSSADAAKDSINLRIQLTDGDGGLKYTATPSFPLLVELLAEVNIGLTPGRSIPSTFMGLSHEWGDVQNNIMGSPATGVNTIYRQLLANLSSYGFVPVNIRIGGNSTDATGEPTSTTVAAFADLAKAMGTHFELGVNLGADNVSLATSQAKAYIEQMPAGSVEAIEIGNEPDEYYKNGYRSGTYTVQDYFNDFNTWKEKIMPVLPSNTKLMGAAWAFYNTLQTSGQSYEAQESDALSVFSQHSYGTSPGNHPADDFLLTPAAATTVPLAVAPGVAMTHSNGLKFRMGEIGAVSDGGLKDVGATFASALWSVDLMFQYANVGVDGVNWLTGSGDYDAPFWFSHTTSRGINTYTLDAVHPLYYGLLFFQVALGDGAQMLPVTLSTQANVTAWATLPNGRLPRVAIINKDESATGTVEVSIPGYSSAQVLRLSAPSYKSTSGITFAGQTFDGSHNGVFHGTHTQQIIYGNNGVFEVPMPVTSAALVIFSK